MNIQYIKYNSNTFPNSLRDIASPPKGLFVKGKIPELPMVAIVGTRKPTSYGQQVTFRLASDLAKAGFCIVSGMALGIDTLVHQATLEAGGSTVAVLGCGLDQPYPRCNTGLSEAIIKSGGAVISEYPSGTEPYKSNFPARNRIIAGLSMAVVVTEADASSGSLITANFALQANRMVMAVPGNISSPRSAGPNNLIRNGAYLVTDAANVLALLGFISPKLVKKKPRADSKQEAMILELLSKQSLTSQQLIDLTKIDAINLASIISLMEITGKIRNLGAGSWVQT
ncbi:DNA-protecting protein DprA [Candidatus Saccharibacteria bacterium]|nr:DNA-protecting protein DprA [Candidatus Saccharibacteria bacterium]